MSKFLCVLGVFDTETQKELAECQQAVLAQGFAGRQTMGIPFHVTLGYFAPECREELKERLASLQAGPVEVGFSHVGLFQGQEVLFLAPTVTRELLDLKEAFGREPGWTAHTTMLIDSRERVLKAAEILGGRFQQFSGKIQTVALYEFFPPQKLGEKLLEAGEA